RSPFRACTAGRRSRRFAGISRSATTRSGHRPWRRPARIGPTTRDGPDSGSRGALVAASAARVMEEHQVQDEVDDRARGQVDRQPLLPMASVSGALVLCRHDKPPLWIERLIGTTNRDFLRIAGFTGVGTERGRIKDATSPGSYPPACPRARSYPGACDPP